MMKKDKNKEELNIGGINEIVVLSKRILKVLFAIIILSIIFLTFLIFKEIKIFEVLLNVLKVISPFFIGLIIAWLLDPIVTALEKKKVKRTIGAIFVFFVFIVVLYLFFRIVIPMLYEQINDFIKIIPNLVNYISGFVNNIFDKFDNSGMDLSGIKNKFFDSIEDLSMDLTTNFPKTFITIVTGAISSIGTFGLGLIVGFYLLIDFNAMRGLITFVPKKNRIAFNSICKKLNTTFRDYLQGTFTISMILFVICSIAFAIVGLPSPMLFGLICGITNVIPYIGPWIGGAIATVVALTVSPLVGVLTVVIVVIAQQIDSIALQPLIMSKAVKLHPVTIMIGLLVFEYFFGVVGMILATPIISAIKIIFSYFNEKYDLINKLKDDNKEVNYE